MKPDICIYHGFCTDGFTAAWAIWRLWPDIEFYGAVHGDPPPDVKGKHVLIVDFSYKRDVLSELGREAKTITILDHHASAEADLSVFKVDELYPLDVLEQLSAFGGKLPIQALFDMKRSGAMMAWQFAFPNGYPVSIAFAEPVPYLVQYVQDRDIWTWLLPDSREISSAISLYDMTFEEWDELAAALEDSDGYAKLVAQGDAIERTHQKQVATSIKVTGRKMVIGGYYVPVANVSGYMASDAGNIMSADYPFAASYYDNAEGERVFSLRSRVGGIDVSKVAGLYGGGGHVRAAGFRMPKGWEGDAV